MKYKMCDVVERVHGNVDRFNTDLKYYVAGEQFECRELMINKKGLLTPKTVNLLGFKFHFPFKAGDVLFMARSPHLRKAGMVTFDGICSDASYILRTKDENVLMQRFLPFIVQSDLMWDYFDSHKTGSVNPLLNWKDFSQFEFELPSIEEQKRIATLLWAVERTRKAYRDLLVWTDELVKSQFVEMFGKTDSTLYDVMTIGDTCMLKSGTTFAADKEQDLGDYLYAKVSDMNLPGNEVYIKTSKTQVSAVTAGNTFIPAGAVIFPKRGGAIGTNKKRILVKDTCVDLNTMGVIPGERLLTVYLYQFFLNMDLMSLADGSAIPQLNNRQIAPVEIIVPPVNKQKEFVELFQQADKSKLAIRQSLESLEKSRNAIMKSIFG